MNSGLAFVLQDHQLPWFVLDEIFVTDSAGDGDAVDKCAEHQVDDQREA